MARQLPENPFDEGVTGNTASVCMQEEPLLSARRWYISRQKIEHHSPSRRDGIDFKKESHLRKSYCLFLQELGMKLKVPQVTIASAIMVCHRFYMRQSHAKNDWQTIATAGIFLACKIEETPRFLKDVAVVSYEMIYKWDPSATKRIRKKEVLSKQKELILIGERLLLSTLAFDLDIQLPYKPLVTALKRLGMVAVLGKVAWNFVNDCLCTTLCLEYKAHYIAAGSMFLASKFQKVKLPLEKGKVWWMEFDVSPKQLEDVIQQMLKLLEIDRKQGLPPSEEKIAQPKAGDEQARVDSSQSCLSSVSVSDQLESRDVMPEAGDCSKSVISDCHPNQGIINHCISAVEVLPGQISDSSSSKEKIAQPKAGDKQARVDSSQSCLSSVSVSDQLESRDVMPEAGGCSKSVISDCHPNQGIINHCISAVEVLPGQISDSGSSKEKIAQPKAGDKQARVDSSQSCLSSVSVSDQLESRDVMPEAGDCSKSIISNCHPNQGIINHCISTVEVLPGQISDSGSSSNAIDCGDYEIFPSTKENYPDQITESTVPVSVSIGHKTINFNQIRETIKRRRLCRATNVKEVQPSSPDIDSEAWIENELEHGIELEYESSLKKQRNAS